MPLSKNIVYVKIEDGDEIGVYCFPSIEDTENALMNWLGERIEEWEDENDKEYNEGTWNRDI